MRRIRALCLTLALILSFVSCTEATNSDPQTTSSSESSVISETEIKSTTETTTETTTSVSTSVKSTTTQSTTSSAITTITQNTTTLSETTKAVTTTTRKATTTTKSTTKPITTTKKQTPSFNENEMYAAYAAAVKENVNEYLVKARWGGYYELFDIDSDGIPELYFHNDGGVIETSSVFRYNTSTKKAEKLDVGLAEPFYSKTHKCILGKSYQRWVYYLCKCYKKNGKIATEEILNLQVNDTMGVQYYDNLDKIDKTEKQYQMVALQKTEINTAYLNNNQKLLNDLKANYAKNKQIMT